MRLEATADRGLTTPAKVVQALRARRASAQSPFTIAWHVQFGPIERDYAIVVATSRDDQPLDQSRSILLALVANGENQEMGWNADRTSVGTRWGHGPTLVNGVPVQLAIPASQVARRLFALDSQGQCVAEIPVARKVAGRVIFELGPTWKTLFYELSDAPRD